MADTNAKESAKEKADPFAEGLDLTTDEGQQQYAARAERKDGHLRKVDPKTGRLEGEYAAIKPGE